jgi:hypothetical protein
MSFAASSVMARAAALCNDASQTTYTNTNLLTHLQNAWLRLEMGFLVNDLPVVEEVSAKLDITANTKVLDSASSPTIPADLVQVYKIEEKPDGAADSQYVEVKQVRTLPVRDQSTELQEYVWREGAITFVGATVAVDIRITYEKKLTAITSASTTIYELDTELYLAAQTAAFAASILGGNHELAGSLQAMADDQYNKILANRVKEGQNLPVRRKAYGYYRRARRVS